MRRFLVAGNWKMNTTLKSGRELATAVRNAVPADRPQVEVLVCPPFPYLIPVGEIVNGSGVALGAQNASDQKPGAFTGEVAVGMLLDAGCKYVILGHSERRQFFGDTDAIVNKKLKTAVAGGLDVILCVGESKQERDENRTESVLDTQMSGSLAGVDAATLAKVVIAYEPVWAIGTGVTATPDQAESAHRYLRNWLASRYNSATAETVRILYGGSVKPDNARELLSLPNVDGALVGGASLKAEQFVPILEAAAAVKK